MNQDTLPKTWELRPLEEVCTIIMGTSPPSSTYNSDGNGLPFFQGKADFTDLHPVARKWCTSPERIAEPQDILLSVRAPVGAVNVADEKSCIGRGLAALRYSNHKFLFYYLLGIKEELDRKGTGTTFKAISAGTVKEIQLPLPPSGEQERIVAKIEELFSELDAGVESLKKAQTQLKTYRQAVLKQAFEGKLFVPQDRPKWQSADVSSNVAKMKKDRECELEKAGIRSRQSSPVSVASETLGELAEGWVWVRPDDISAPEKYALGIGPFGSNLKVSDYRERGVPLVFVKNVTRNDFNRDVKFIDNAKFEELIAHSVKPLDLVITKMGDPPGDCEIYPETAPPAVITSDCLKFRIWDKYANRKFYRYCIESQMIRKQLGVITKGVAQKKISLDRFRSIFLPFTTKEEQDLVVEEIESHLSVCDKLEETIAASLKQSEALRQSILKQAFGGKLVDQDENDEPASVLLQRTRFEREAVEEEQKKNKKKTKRAGMTEKLKTILEILQESRGPIPTRRVWQASTHKDDIDAFYVELKQLFDQKKIKETERDGRESFLTLAA